MGLVNQRETETITGTVILVSESLTGVKVRGLSKWLNWPRDYFNGKPAPKRGQIWTFEYEHVEMADGREVLFVRSEIYVSEAEPEQMKSQQVTEENGVDHSGRPSFEDSEWYWTIRDERGNCIKVTGEEYKSSTAWKKRAKMRLELDDYRCKANLPGCTISATQVHHLNYFYIGCEPLWCIQSVCDNCHVLITSMDRKKPAA